jgi:hypothetical protein
VSKTRKKASKDGEEKYHPIFLAKLINFRGESQKDMVWGKGGKYGKN